MSYCVSVLPFLANTIPLCGYAMILLFTVVYLDDICIQWNVRILSVAIPRFVIHLSVDKHLGCSHFSAEYNVVLDVYVRVYEWHWVELLSLTFWETSSLSEKNASFISSIKCSSRNVIHYQLLPQNWHPISFIVFWNWEGSLLSAGCADKRSGDHSSSSWSWCDIIQFTFLPFVYMVSWEPLSKFTSVSILGSPWFANLMVIL